MSKTNGLLYHRSNEKELRERSDWNELSAKKKKQLGKLGWFETESLYPPDRYWDGKIENRVPHGQGTFYVSSAATFVGTYKDGKRHEGTFTWADGDKYIGNYKDNKRWNGTRYDKEGNIIEIFVTGEQE
jgi:hypothetical protein